MPTATLLPTPDVLPSELLGFPNWLGWRALEREGRVTKVPVSPRTGRLASSTDAATWSTFDQAAAFAAQARCDGIGFVFTASPFVGIDLDHCIDLATGEVAPWALAIVERFGTYTEVSPSGTGLHLIVRGELPEGGHRTRVNGPGAHPEAAIEVYDQGRYFTITGQHLGGIPFDIAERGAELAAWHAETFPPKSEPEREHVTPTPVGVDDAALLELMFAAPNGAAVRALWDGDTSRHGGNDSSADQALCNHLAFWTNRDPARMDRLFRQSGLMRKKWERKDYRERTIAEAIRVTPEGYAGPTLRVDATKPEAPPPRRQTGPALIDAPTLWVKEFEPPQYAVPGLLPQGLCILAGRPKMGKSWLALGLALSVASGEKALGAIEIEPGRVLYMALEDGERRLQGRLQELRGDEPPPSTLTFATQWPRFPEGKDDLELWLAGHPDARLVVIDTFKRVRPEEKRGASVYGQDYEAVAPISDLAHQFSVSIVLVMHTRKMDSPDPIDLISGSLGLAGASDGALVMQRERGSADASLAVIDRDAEDKTLALRWNIATGGWLLLGDAEQYRRSHQRNEILAALHDFGACSPKDLAAQLGRNNGTVRRLLWELRQGGHVANLGGTYRALSLRPTDIPSFYIGEQGEQGERPEQGERGEQ